MAGEGLVGTVGFIYAWEGRGEKLHKATDTILQTQGNGRMGSLQQYVLGEPFHRCPLPHTSTVTNEYLQPHLTSQECGLVPILSTTELSEPWFSPRNGMTPATVPCNRAHERQGGSAPFPHRLLRGRLPFPSHLCPQMPGTRGL